MAISSLLRKISFYWNYYWNEIVWFQVLCISQYC